MIERRTFLGGAALLAAGALAGCGGDKQADKNSSTANQAVKLPTYAAFAGVKPDLAGSADGIRPAFLTYPSERPASVPGQPGSGGKYRAMVNIYEPLPPGPDKNQLWQAINDKLGVDLELTMVPAGEYGQKLATTLAGNDLPDFVLLYGVPHLPRLLQAKFADLTELLFGDAIKDYPNLANIPSQSWKSCVYNGAIYGVPLPRAKIGTGPFIRADIARKAGMSPQPKNFEEFHELAKAVTDPKRRRWAFSNASYPLTITRVMLDAPNGWREDGGKLTHVNETEEQRKALDVAARFWKEGLVHPDAFGAGVPFLEWFSAGTTVIQPDGYVSWSYYVKNNVNNPTFELDYVRIPGYDGGEGRIAAGRPSFMDGLTAFKQADKEKLREQLRIANWLAAPFGTAEYHLRVYGIEGTHHTISKTGDPTLTSAGSAQTTVPFRFVTEAPSTIYQPGRPHDAELQHAYETAVVPKAILNPVVGAYSNTQASKGPTIDGKLADMQSEVIQGRKSLQDWDSAVAAWRQAGGDQIRTEYEDQLQKQGGT